MNSDPKQFEEFDRELDALFAEYRGAFPDPEPSVNFMPHLWRKIEASQTFSMSMRRWTQGFVTAAVALCLMMMLYLSGPGSQGAPMYAYTYVDVLSTDDEPDTLAYSVASYEGSGDTNIQ
jgi:hypothetical protein